MAVCGFSKTVVNDTFKHRFPIGKDLEARFMYLADGETRFLLGVFDFSYRFRRTILRFREALSQATGIPVSHIWAHDLQNHEGPVALDLEGEACERLIARCVPAVREAIDRAEEAELSYGVADLGNRYNLLREQYVPGVGAVTIWLGWHYDPSDGRAWSDYTELMLLCGWKPDVPSMRERVYFDRPCDQQATLVALRSAATGKILGHLCRFTAHAAILSGQYKQEEWRHNPDWPGYLREALEARLGGVGLALCGPCGDVCPTNIWAKSYAHGVQEAERITGGVAEACLAAFTKNAAPWEPVRLGKLARADLDLPLRATIPRSRQEFGETLKARQKEAWDRFNNAIKEGRCASEIKRLCDDAQHIANMIPICDRWAGLSDDEMARGVMAVEIEALRVNDLVLAGLPGESMTSTCLWLKAATVGSRLLLFDQVNGYCVYQTTPEQYDQGGYAYWCGAVARNAEPATRSKALEVIKAALGAS